jgi:hypothetical protein
MAALMRWDRTLISAKRGIEQRPRQNSYRASQKTYLDFARNKLRFHPHDCYNPKKPCARRISTAAIAPADGVLPNKRKITLSWLWLSLWAE